MNSPSASTWVSRLWNRSPGTRLRK
jgi:hypothetical protein